MSVVDGQSRTVSRVTSVAGAVGGFARVVWNSRALVRELVARDVRGGHAGHGLGSMWVYAQPVVIVASFMLVFGVVIGSKLAITSTFPGDYTSYILVGVVPWLLMAAVLGRATGAFSSNANLVKQVVFPIETLPVASMIACFAIYGPAVALMLAYKIGIGGGVTWLVVLLPVVLALQWLLSVGLTLLLSVTTPFVRDIREVVTMYTAVSMYFTPAVYLPEWVPALIRPVLYLNPFSYVVWVYQDVLFFGEIRHAFAWVVFAVMAVAAFVVGLVIFRRVKPYLGNVL